MIWRNDEEAKKILDQLSKDVRTAFGELAGEAAQIGREYADEMKKNVGAPLRAEILKRITNEDGTLNEFAQTVADHPRAAVGAVGMAKGVLLGAAAGPFGAKLGMVIGGLIGAGTGPRIVRSIIDEKTRTANDPPPPAVETPPPASGKPEKRRKPRAFKIDE